jgi:hypothetical protein
MTAGFPLPHRPRGFSRARGGSVEKSLHASHTEILTLPAKLKPEDFLIPSGPHQSPHVFTDRP